jgi:hypothetical protein
MADALRIVVQRLLDKVILKQPMPEGNQPSLQKLVLDSSDVC